MQIAKAFGAEVTGACSTRNLDLVRSIGAAQVIDYTQEDLSQTGQRYDLVFDVVAKRSFSDCRRALKPQGIYVTTAFSPLLVLAGLWRSVTGNQKMVPLPPKPPRKSDLVLLKELLEQDKVAPVLDRHYTLRELPDALWHLAKGHARGRIVITV